MTGTPEWRAWIHIKTRCFNKNTPYYHLYGGRGITMHAEWRASFESFLTHVGMRPSPKHSIDRIDNEGHYVPGNIRWATNTEQVRNRRSTIRLTLKGETLTLSEWCTKLGLKEVTVKRRLYKGWPVPLALSTLDFRRS